MPYDRYRQDQRFGASDRDDRYGDRDYGSSQYRGQYEHNDRQQPRGGYDRDDYGSRSYGGGRGGYGSDVDRLATPRDYGHDSYGRSSYGERDRGYGRATQGDRGFLDRAGDEVRSWFGDEEAERRREQDARAERERDRDYGQWRQGQIDALDRDYDEYRRENRTRFESEFGSWRTDRQGQRDSLTRVEEHMDVVGSDGSHVGTVDKIRGDRIVLTKSDEAAGGRHHSIPSRWIQSVDDKVTLRKSADEAKHEWRDEERNQAFFGADQDEHRDSRGSGLLNRSFSGTY